MDPGQERRTNSGNRQLETQMATGLAWACALAAVFALILTPLNPHECGAIAAVLGGVAQEKAKDADTTLRFVGLGAAAVGVLIFLGSFLIH